jgi:hypothetical protein
MSPPGRPKGEFRRAQPEGTPVNLRAAAPGRPKQGPTLSEGRLPYSASGVSQ